MKKNILIITFIIIGLIIIMSFRDFNFKRAVSACMTAHKMTTKSSDPKEVKKMCEERISKSK